MQEVDFWSDINKAQEITQNAKSIKDKLDNFKNLEIRTEDVQILIEMSLEEEDSSSYKDIKSELKSIGEEIENLNIETLLSGEYDRNNAILELHTGAGGNDAQDWTNMLYRMYTRWCEAHGFKLCGR